MKLSAFKQHLLANPDKHVGFVFDDGDAIPERFHVTEVGHVVKNFIDCGGTVRKVASAQLQIWLGEDMDHRLTAGRLAKIIDLAGPILPDDTLPVEVEYENCVLSQYTVEAVNSTDQQVMFSLADKHTDCLAKELCCPTPAAAGAEAGCGCGPKCC